MGDLIDIQEGIDKLVSEFARRDNDASLAESKILTDALSVFRDFRSIQDDDLRAALGQIVSFVASVSAERDLASAQSSNHPKPNKPAGSTPNKSD